MGKVATFTATNEGDTVIFDQAGLGANDPVLKFSTDAAGDYSADFWHY